MPALSWPLRASILCWFAFEVGLLARDLANPLGAGAGHTAGDAFAVVGVVVIWVGLAVRVWAVLTLAGLFSTFIQVDADQAVVTRGPYRWVRHPSYTGLLLIALGLGLSAGNWLSLVVCVAGTTLGLVPRIAVEESELTKLGTRTRKEAVVRAAELGILHPRP